MAGRRIFYGVTLLGCLLFYIYYQQWFSYILLLSVLMLPWLSMAVSLRAIRHLRAEPLAAAKLPLGAEENARLHIWSKGVHPPVKSKVCATKPITGERWVLRPGDPLPTGHCGGLVLQLHKPRVYDFLGLFRFRVRNTAPTTCQVMPAPITVKAPAQLTQYMARGWRPKPGGGFAENHEIRPYRPGDNLNQIHWKLSAKTGELMLREAMEPVREWILLTMDLCGTPSELDRKFGRLLYLGNWLVAEQSPFQVCVLTGDGLEVWTVYDQWDMQRCMDSLLFAPFTPAGSAQEQDSAAPWQLHIGGEPDAE